MDGEFAFLSCVVCFSFVWRFMMMMHLKRVMNIYWYRYWHTIAFFFTALHGHWEMRECVLVLCKLARGLPFGMGYTCVSSEA